MLTHKFCEYILKQLQERRGAQTKKTKQKAQSDVFRLAAMPVLPLHGLCLRGNLAGSVETQGEGARVSNGTARQRESVVTAPTPPSGEAVRGEETDKSHVRGVHRLHSAA